MPEFCCQISTAFMIKLQSYGLVHESFSLFDVFTPSLVQKSWPSWMIITTMIIVSLTQATMVQFELWHTLPPVLPSSPAVKTSGLASGTGKPPQTEGVTPVVGRWRCDELFHWTISCWRLRAGVCDGCKKRFCSDVFQDYSLEINSGTFAVNCLPAVTACYIRWEPKLGTVTTILRISSASKNKKQNMIRDHPYERLLRF